MAENRPLKSEQYPSQGHKSDFAPVGCGSAGDVLRGIQFPCLHVSGVARNWIARKLATAWPICRFPNIGDLEPHGEQQVLTQAEAPPPKLCTHTDHGGDNSRL